MTQDAYNHNLSASDGQDTSAIAINNLNIKGNCQLQMSPPMRSSCINTAQVNE